MIKLEREYIKYLEDNIKCFNDELIKLVELPDVSKLRSRIKKDKRDTKAMLILYKQIEAINNTIRYVKAEMRDCIKQANKQLGRDIKKTGIRRVKCIVCKEDKPENEMDGVNICNHCRGKEDDNN